MATGNYQVGHHKMEGNPEADWSHAGSYLAGLYTESLYAGEDLPENSVTLDQEFRQRLIEAGGVDRLSEEDLALIASLDSDIDLSYLPGGKNYKVSTVSPDNPLGLPGNLWALVEEAEDGALVAGLITPAGDGELDMMVPGGRGWEPLNDLSVIEGYTLVGVNPEAVELYHNYDRANTLGVIGSYPLSPEGPSANEAQMAVPMPRWIAPKRTEGDEFWKNSGESPEDADAGSTDEAMMASAVVIQGADDLDTAIAAAAEDPEIRWYVERRMQALGLEADLPWQEG